MTSDRAKLLAALTPILNSSAAPVFLCGVDQGDASITLHIHDEKSVAKVKSAARTALSAAGLTGKIVVRAHALRTLTRPRHLEAFVALFAHEAILHDPTAVFGRAQALIGALRNTRATLGTVVRGAYLDPELRIVFVTMPVNPAIETLLSVSQRISDTMEGAVESAAVASGSPAFNRPPIRVRAVTDLPSRNLIPIDNASFKLARVRSRQMRKWAAGLMAALGLGSLAAPAMAQQQMPAVSAPNFKLDARGGFIDSQDKGIDGVAGILGGAYAAPIGQQFGVQIDASVGLLDKELYASGAGQLFWRNPAVGLLGLVGQYATLDHADLMRAGARGELYLDRFTLGAIGGYQWGTTGHDIRVKDGAFGAGEVRFYATDNFMIRGIGGAEPGGWFGRGGVEFVPGFAALPGLSIFFDGGAGSNHHSFALFGLRYYFGPEKSLIRRHREDDPEIVPLTELSQWRKKPKHAAVGSGP